MSFTILPFINPPCGGIDITNAVAGVAGIDNQFTVSQTMAGLVDSGALSVAGLSSLSGGLSVLAGAVSLPLASIADSALSANVPLKNVANTFSAVNTFSQPPVLSGASISAGTIPALAHVDKSLGDAQIALAGIGQSSIASGYVDLLSAQSVSGVKTFSQAPVLSGASISAGTIPALSVVNKSLGDAQITLAGIGQSSIASGYVDLASAQSVAGIKTFSSACIFSANLTCSGGISGNLSGNATSATTATTASQVAITSDNTNGSYWIPFVKSNIASDSLFVDEALTPLLTYNPSLGLLTAGVLTVPGTTTLSNVILPSSFIACTTIAGILTIPMGGFSLGNFSHTTTENINDIAITSPVVGSRAVLVVTGGSSARTMSKNVSVAGQVILNSLSGNTNIASGSTWICNIFVISAGLISMTWANVT